MGENSGGGDLTVYRKRKQKCEKKKKEECMGKAPGLSATSLGNLKIKPPVAIKKKFEKMEKKGRGKVEFLTNQRKKAAPQRPWTLRRVRKWKEICR